MRTSKPTVLTAATTTGFADQESRKLAKKGSEQPGRYWFAGTDSCSSCEKKLTLKNFGVVRTIYPSRRREVLCLSCQQAMVDELILDQRQRLGLDEPPDDF